MLDNTQLIACEPNGISVTGKQLVDFVALVVEQFEHTTQHKAHNAQRTAQHTTHTTTYTTHHTPPNTARAHD